jgi:hypothetical protein
MQKQIKTDIQKTLDYKLYNNFTVASGIALAVVGGIAIYAIKKALKDKTLSQVEKSIVKNKLTYPEMQYYIFADQLEQIMQNSMTKGYKVFPVFEQMQNDSDISQLIIAFGERTNYWFGVPTFKKNLPYWIKDELSNNELKQLNEMMEEKQINLKF